MQEPKDPNVSVSVLDLIGLRSRIDGLALKHGQPSRSVITGSHRSRFRGRGMDYLESRHYQAGDDIRNMDWRITARAGRPHVKLYEEERERPIVVLLDLSPSMFFGTRGAFKSVIAARIAAVLGWVAIANHDRIGALLFNGEHRELPPAGGRRAVMRLIRALAEAGDPVASLAHQTNPGAMSVALARLRRVARPGSLVFLVSDFYSIDDETGRHLGKLRRHCDIVACQVADPLELALPPAGRYGITDGERTGVLDTRSHHGRRGYEAYLAQHQSTVRNLTSGRGIPLVHFPTDEDPVAHLGAGLEQLGRRRAGRLEAAA